MKQNRTNQENPDTANFADLLNAAGLTDQEAAKASSLHVNTVKKIVRGDHVHPNSRLKLFRTLRPTSDTTVLQYPKSVMREVPKVSDYTPQAKKHAVQKLAEQLSREVFELTLELVAGRAKLSESEYDEMVGLVDLARTTLTNAKPKT